MSEDLSKRAAPQDVRLFLSSTFSDMAAERDHLVTVVYPEIEARLARLGLSFFDVDLRWGVTEETTNIWRECAARIEKTAPLFVGILGRNYGTRVKPHEMKNEERAIWGDTLSYTELEIRYGAFGELPDGLPPLASPERRHAFFLRDDNKSHQHEQNRLRKEIKERCEGWPIGHALGPCRPYSTDSTKQLEKFGSCLRDVIWRLILTHPAYFPQEFWEGLAPGVSAPAQIFATDAPIPEGLWMAFVERVRAARSMLEAENLDLTRFRTERVRNFHGREDEIKDAVDHLRGVSGDHSVRVVHAIPGRGKTAFMCAVAQELAEFDDVDLIDCYIGASERLSTEAGLLSRIIALLDSSHRFADPTAARQATVRDLEGSVLSALRRRERPVAILVDGLDQLADAGGLSWAPKDASKNVRILVARADLRQAQRASAKEKKDSEAFEQKWAGQQLALAPLNADEVEAVAVAMMADYGKELSPEEKRTLRNYAAAREPLYLAVLMRELRALSGDGLKVDHESPHSRIEKAMMEIQSDAPTTMALFNRLFERLEHHGAQEARLWIASLALSREGLSPHALAILLKKLSNETGDPISHRLRRTMRAYLQRRGLRIAYFHLDLRFAALTYAGAPPASEVHRRIGEALQETWDQSPKEIEDALLMAERLYHLAEAGDWNGVLEFLRDEKEPSALEAVLDVPGGGFTFSRDVTHAYKLAIDSGEMDVAAAIVDAVVTLLSSDKAAKAHFTLTRVNAWLGYDQEAQFFDALLQRSARLDLQAEDIARLAGDRERDLTYRARSRIAGRIRRFGGVADLEERLHRAETMLSEIVGSKSAATPSVFSRFIEKIRGVLRRRDDRLGSDIYELGYIQFLRGELNSARSWFLYGAQLSENAGAETGMWISRCLAANCRFIERFDEKEGKDFARLLVRARRVFTRRADDGDPDAQRWIMNTIAHGMEAAAAAGDGDKVRRLCGEFLEDPWIVQFGTERSAQLRYRALSAEFNEDPAEAIELYSELIAPATLPDHFEQKARYAWRYGLQLERSGELDRAKEVWRNALGYPPNAGNRPWQVRNRARLERYTD